jgi:hypothetical protein
LSTLNLEYFRLVTAAQDKGILKKKLLISLKEVAYKAQHYQEQVLRKRFLDLPHHCDQDLFDFMLNITIDEQKELAPYMVSSMKLADEVEVTVRAGFESYVQKKKEKCCTLNIEEILKEENWKKFLNLVV